MTNDDANGPDADKSKDSSSINGAKRLTSWITPAPISVVRVWLPYPVEKDAFRWRMIKNGVQWTMLQSSEEGIQPQDEID